MPTLKQIASLVDGEIIGDSLLEISGVSEIQNGRPGTITFLGNPSYSKYLASTEASAIITNDRSLIVDRNGLVVQNPTLAISKVLSLFFPEETPANTIHPSAIIHESARIGKNVTIEPGVVIDANVTIGDRCWIRANTVMGKNVVMGSDCHCFSNVSLYHDVEIGNRAIIHSNAVLGSDGFGFVNENGKNEKIPHTGKVILGDDVEIGASTTIDRGTIGNTVIGNDVKLDNQVQIAHNVKLGDGCRIGGGGCVGGSTNIGENTITGGMVGFINSLTIGPNSAFAASSIVTKSLPGNQIYAGNPAREIKEKNKRDAALTEIPRIKKQLDKLQEQVKNN